MGVVLMRARDRYPSTWTKSQVREFLVSQGYRAVGFRQPKGMDSILWMAGRPSLPAIYRPERPGWTPGYDYPSYVIVERI